MDNRLSAPDSGSSSSFDWVSFSNLILSNSDPKERELHLEKELSDLSMDEMHQRFRESVAVSYVRKGKKTSQDSELDKKRMEALRSLPEEERLRFFEAMNCITKAGEKSVVDQQNILSSKIRAAKASGVHSRTVVKRVDMLRKAAVNSSPHITIDCEALQKQIMFVLTVAEHFGIHPSEVDQAKEFEYKDACARLAEKELLESLSKGGKKSKKSKKKKKPLALTQSPKLTKESSSVSEGESPAYKVLRKVTDILKASENETVEELPRVTQRWRSKNLHELRNLVDVVNGNFVKRYLKMNAEELLLQRSFHYLPGVESLLAAPEARKKYTFLTSRGCGILAKLFKEDAAYDGIIYFGIETNVDGDKIHRKVYHKYFERIASMDQIFKDFQENLPSEDVVSAEPCLQTIMTIKENGILDVKFEQEEYRLEIYPIKI